MSRTFSLGCRDCKIHLWVAQGVSGTDGHFYFDEKFIRDNLYEFLYSHMNHSLIFVDKCNDLVDFEDYDDWVEIDEDE